ncbi:hypothetical protein GXP70_28600 [Paenibacillus lycopersici]|uniref:Uncharacterized protein n=1 Tax=Paenibacillus lycopersici TaxID=2704462 RepID=A0A6C0G7B2_9BACL|nr:hypothetical protein [Paenibacillus lycopersici]QHT63525.1 hypothetical protein GXP70_28600 [Paenibacillus lycopersici]
MQAKLSFGQLYPLQTSGSVNKVVIRATLSAADRQKCRQSCHSDNFVRRGPAKMQVKLPFGQLYPLQTSGNARFAGEILPFGSFWAGWAQATGLGSACAPNSCLAASFVRPRRGIFLALE